MKNTFKIAALALVIATSFAACKGKTEETAVDSTKVDSTVVVDSTKTDTVKVDSAAADTAKKM